MKVEALKQLVCDYLDASKAEDISSIDVSKFSDIADIMVLATGTSRRHTKSLADNLMVHCKEYNVEVFGSEGQESGEWVLVDLGSVLVHVMQAETREHYQLEKLWEAGLSRKDF